MSPPGVWCATGIDSIVRSKGPRCVRAPGMLAPCFVSIVWIVQRLAK